MPKRFEPDGLPRQRKGITPGMVGRYPDYDVLDERHHWDELTRKLVLDRVENVPEFRYFNIREKATLEPLCDHITGQVGEEPRIPLLAFVDQKLASASLDGYQYFDMPGDGQTWRATARGLDEEAQKIGVESFPLLTVHDQKNVVHRFSKAELFGGAWAELNVSRAFSVLVRQICEQFYSHPWAWNEIGFGGPAYPRGYARFGSPHLRNGETESWEGLEAFELDPVRDTRERELD